MTNKEILEIYFKRIAKCLMFGANQLKDYPSEEYNYRWILDHTKIFKNCLDYLKKEQDLPQGSKDDLIKVILPDLIIRPTFKCGCYAVNFGLLSNWAKELKAYLLFGKITK